MSVRDATSDWPLRQQYGFGAARIRLCPEPSPTPRSEVRLGDALASAAAELRAGGREALRDWSWVVPGSALLAALLIALVATLGREHRDDSALRIVRFVPPAVLEEPPSVPRPEPAPPLPEVVPDPPPPPPAARAEPPPPPPRPEPVAPPPRAARPAPARPAPPPTPKPSLRIDAVARHPAPAPPPAARAARAQPAPAPRSVPRVDPVAPAFAVAEDPAPARTTRAALPAARRAPAPRPDLPVPVASAPAAPAERVFADASRAARPGRVAPAADRGRAERPPSLDLAAPAAPASRRPAPAPAPVRPARAEAPGPPQAARGDSQDRLAGVPLGSLAACVSDRREDELKLRLLASLSGRRECASPAGRYRFVETKNLNAFLMWIERAPGRARADRCIELTLAIECLASGAGKGARRG